MDDSLSRSDADIDASNKIIQCLRAVLTLKCQTIYHNIIMFIKNYDQSEAIYCVL